MLLYLVKHSRPDITNATRELSKVMDGATEAHRKEMLRIIGFMLGTKTWGLKLQPDDDDDVVWHLVAYCDTTQHYLVVNRGRIRGNQ